MCSRIIPLLFIGFSSPAYSVTENIENKQSSGRFITLRDYDFVGEDPTLAARLAERMAVLQAPLNLSALQPPGPSAPAAQRLWQPWQPRALPLQPDYLRSRLKLPQMINVSLDYAEIVNGSDWFLETNASSPASGPAAISAPGYADQSPDPGAALVLNPAAALVPGPGAALLPGSAAARVSGLRAELVSNPDAPPSLGEALGLGPAEEPGLGSGATPVSGHGAAAAPESGAPLDAVDGRRRDIQTEAYNYKILDLMKHSIYGTQRKIMELDKVIKKHEADPRFRMAYIYNRLDEWKQNLRTLHYATYKPRYWHYRIKTLIWYYEHALRINIDITYSVEHLVHLHSEYMKKMELIVPLETRQAISDKKKLEKKLEKMKQMGFGEPSILAAASK